MINLYFGIVKKYEGVTLSAAVDVFGQDVEVSGVRVVTPAGQGAVFASVSFTEGSQVAILFDDVTGAAVCLGGVPGGEDTAAKADCAALKAKKIDMICETLSVSKDAPNDTRTAAARADYVAQAINSLIQSFNAHTHVCAAPGSASAAPVPLASKIDAGAVSAECLKIS